MLLIPHLPTQVSQCALFIDTDQITGFTASAMTRARQNHRKIKTPTLGMWQRIRHLTLFEEVWLSHQGAWMTLPRLWYVPGGLLNFRGILRAWLDKAEPSWQWGVLVYSWNHFSNLSLTVLRDGLSIMLQLWRKKGSWIVFLQWRRQREKHQHCGSHLVAYLPANMCPKSSLCCIKERKSFDICFLTSSFPILHLITPWWKEEQWLHIAAAWFFCCLPGALLPMGQTNGHRRRETLFLEDCSPFILEWLLKTRI